MKDEQLNKWIYRLQEYISRVKTATSPEGEKLAIIRLLGFLESLEILIK